MSVLSPARGFDPNWSTHPGEHLDEFLEVNGWSQAELARRTGLTPKLVSEIVNGKNPVTPETALRLERVLGLKAEVWLGLQSSWDLFHARLRERKAASRKKSRHARPAEGEPRLRGRSRPSPMQRGAQGRSRTAR